MLQLGDATVRIGDPTDRLQARSELGTDQRLQNITSMKSQLHNLWGHMEEMMQERGQVIDHPTAGLTHKRRVDANNRWLSKLTITEYLATVGQCGKMGAMLSRDTVRNRLEKGESMSLAEFNYPMIQAYDWWYMFQETGVELQIGGSDQYGNIVAGMDLIDHMVKNHDNAAPYTERKPFGITTPLLTSSAGEKFGKSAGNAVWLDATLTKPFDLYGYLLRTADADVERFLRLLTLVPESQIRSVMVEHQTDPTKRKAQHLLALEICRLAHGKDWAARTVAEHERSRRLTLSEVTSTNLDRKSYIPKSLFAVSSIGQVLVYAGMVESASKGNTLRQSGGLYRAKPAGKASDELEFEQVPKSPTSSLDLNGLLIQGTYLILRSGKWRTSTLEVLDDEEFDRKGLEVVGTDDWRQRVLELKQRQQVKKTP